MTQPGGVEPREIRKVGTRELKVLWSDGHASVYPFWRLRENCPCAACVNELTGERMIPPGSVSKEVGATKVEVVGNYALGFVFTDNHFTGIYKFETLRNLCPCCREESKKSKA